MLKIGDFSRLSQVSVKTLRYYDEVGLLKPTQVDQVSGYRYYSVAQLRQLHRILALRDLGFSLEQIAHVLDGEPSIEALKSSVECCGYVGLNSSSGLSKNRSTWIESRLFFS